MDFDQFTERPRVGSSEDTMRGWIRLRRTRYFVDDLGIWEGIDAILAGAMLAEQAYIGVGFVLVLGQWRAMLYSAAFSFYNCVLLWGMVSMFVLTYRLATKLYFNPSKRDRMAAALTAGALAVYFSVLQFPPW